MKPEGSRLPVDESVKIPKAVRAAAAAADAHYTPPAEPPAEPPADPLPTPPVEPPVTPAGNDPVPPATPPVVSEASWEQRFKAENGRYRAALGTIQQKDQLISGYETIIEDLRSQLATPVSKPTTPAERLVTDKDREDFGEEMLGVVSRQAQEALTPELIQIKSQVQELTNILQGTARQQQLTARQQMEKDLTEALPNWREVNFDEKFMAWLALPDAFSGAKRHDLLKRAYEQNATPRVLAFFKGFLAEEAALDPQPGLELVPAVEQPQKPSLEQFAAPGRAKTSAAQPPVEKPTITTSQIDAFYASVRKGQYNGREEEKDRLERMIFAAQAEGRVQRR